MIFTVQIFHISGWGNENCISWVTIISESLFSNVSGLTICLASSFFMCKFSFILSPLSWDCFCPNELLMWIRPWHYIPDLQSHNSQSISVTVQYTHNHNSKLLLNVHNFVALRHVIILINKKKLCTLYNTYCLYI